MTRSTLGFAFVLALLASTILTQPASAQAKTADQPAAKPPAAATPQPGPRGIGIAATVNDDPITISDIDNRIDLYLLGAPGAPTPQMRAVMAQQVLAKLVDEKLQMQAAKSMGISVGDDQVIEAMGSVAQKNNATTDEFKARLIAQGIRPETLYDQLRAEIAWSQVIRRKLRPQINVTEAEIDSEFDQMDKAAGIAPKTAEEKPAAPPAASADAKPVDDTVAALATGAEAPKTDAAETTPATPATPATPDAGSAASVDSADTAAAAAAVSAATNAPAAPATQKAEIVSLKQIMIPLTPEDSADIVNAKMARAASLRNKIKNCADFDAEMKNFDNPGTLDMGRGPFMALPPALQALVRPMEVGTPSSPVRTGDGRGIAVLIVCEKTMADIPAGAPAVAQAPAPRLDRTKPEDREAVANRIGIDRLNKMADRYLRDLKATAYIDKRI